MHNKYNIIVLYMNDSYIKKYKYMKKRNMKKRKRYMEEK